MGQDFVGKVGPAMLPDGDLQNLLRFTHEGGLAMMQLGGKYQEHLLRGEAFIYSTAATGVTGAVAGTASAPMIWNPSDSGKILIPLLITYGAISGTVIAAHVGFAYKLNCGASIGTGAPVVSYTGVAPLNALVGHGQASKMNFAPATCSLTGAPVYGGNLGLSAGGALAAGPLFQMIADLTDGLLAFKPGTAFFPYVSNAAIALVASVTVIGIEIPVPSFA
jgi:hypothetical protein